MDRSMKNTSNKPSSRLTSTEWEALIARIQSPSKELEANLAKSNSNLIEALSGLEELENLTQKHLAPPEPILPPAPSAQAAGLAAGQAGPQSQLQPQPPPQPMDPVKYQTSHEEYAPALNQSALVEALLQYQRKKALRNPKPASTSSPRSTASKNDLNTPAFTRSDFVQMRVPAIDAEPKKSPLGRAAAPSVRLPVLRLKSENPSANAPSGNSPGNLDDDQD